MSEHEAPLRLAVVVAPGLRMNETALRFLILAMNKEQDAIQFEFYNLDSGDPLLQLLTGRRRVDRTETRNLLPDFIARSWIGIARKVKRYKLSEQDPPDHFVVVSQCRFGDNFYSVRRGGATVLGLGNWKRYMAPPSFHEFVQSLLVREAIAALCPSLNDSVHLGNKGCALDFTERLPEARQKALRGFVCHHCRSRMREDGKPELADTVVHLLDRAWLGQPTDPRSPAGIMANLGYDLFISKGLKETPREVFVSLIRQEGAKQILAVAAAVLLAALLLVLGLVP